MIDMLIFVSSCPAFVHFLKRDYSREIGNDRIHIPEATISYQFIIFMNHELFSL